MSLELEVLDQLEGGEMPLGVVAALFPDESHARRALLAMLRAGDLKLLDVDGAELAAGGLRELERQPASWRMAAHYRLALTDAGARRVR